MSKNIILFQSVTYAIKVKKLLSKYGIKSVLVKTDGNDMMIGCTHGIEVCGRDYLDTIRILRENLINYKVL